MKTCTVCKIQKDLSEFGKQKGANLGLRSACKKCHTEKAKLYVASNKAKVQAYQKIHYLENREKIINKTKLYRAENLERIKLINSQWKKENSDLVRIYNQNRKAKKRMQTGLISKDIVKKLMILQSGKCANCAIDLHDSGHHLDHMMPIDLGGLHADENLQLLCPTCNLRKFNKDPIVWANENGRLL